MNIFKELWAEVVLALGKKLPKGAIEATDALIALLNTAKTWESSAGAKSLAVLIPNGLGAILLTEVQKITNDSLITLEVAKGAEEAASGITDPAAKADAIFSYMVANVNKLPAAWQGKHWLDICTTIISKALNLTTTEANAIVNIQYGKLNSPVAATGSATVS